MAIEVEDILLFYFVIVVFHFSFFPFPYNLQLSTNTTNKTLHGSSISQFNQDIFHKKLSKQQLFFIDCRVNYHLHRNLKYPNMSLVL